jgi:spore photoproduct lyase
MEIVKQALTAKYSNQSPMAGSVAPRKPWQPRQVLFTPAALEHAYGQEILSRVSDLGISVQKLSSNRVTGLKGKTEQETYRRAKSTMAVVVAPPSAFKLQPIPPSADWQFYLAQGCPAHCQYCYLAGSLSGPPVIRVYANLPNILQNLKQYAASPATTFEASCYTDPLSLEHLTGGLAKTIKFFGSELNANLRWVTKFARVEPILQLNHQNRTRCRISINLEEIASRQEGGTDSLTARLQALRQLSLPKSRGGGGYPIGIVLAPIFKVPDWQEAYGELLTRIREVLDFEVDLTFELITHRFTPGSRDLLLSWYPNTKIDFGEEGRSAKYNKFGGLKYVYKAPVMRELKTYFYDTIELLFPKAKILYWT